MTRAKDIAGTAKLYRKLAEREGGGGGEAKVAPSFLPFFQTPAHPPFPPAFLLHPVPLSFANAYTRGEGTKYSARGQVNRARKSALHSRGRAARRASPQARNNNTPRSIGKNNIFIPPPLILPTRPADWRGLLCLRRRFFDSRWRFISSSRVPYII